MSTEQFFTACAITILLLPTLAFLWLGANLLIQRRPSELMISRISGTAQLGSLLAAITISMAMMFNHTDQVVVDLGAWFIAANYEFEIVFLIDRLSMPFVLLTCILTGIVGRFSRSYLHHESGYARFFLLMLMFLVGMLCLAMGGTIDLLFAGWELVGLSSALLIGFFQHRKEPVLNGLRTFAVYRICDVGLLVGAILLHHYAHTAEFDLVFTHAHWPVGLPDIPTAPLHVIGLLFLLAAMGKSGQVPFGNWLPRAMEGPTPSSAIFYGGISIHAGAYLLLRMSPLLERSAITMVSIVVIGLLTAIYGTLVGRVQCDVKNQLAYSAMAQVGLIFVEIGFGFHFFALLHMGGHATLRTLQFLRSATVLREFNRLKAATGGSDLSRGGGQYEFLFPMRLRRWLYTAAMRGCDMDAVVQSTLVGPLMKIAGSLERIEERWAGNIDAKRVEP